MSVKRHCPECGVSVSPDVAPGLCPRCLMGASASATRSYEPAARAPGGGPSTRPTTVDFEEFRRAAVEVGLVDSATLDLFAEGAAGDVARLARALIRAGKLTSYQAGALARGKAKGLVIGPCLVLEKRGQGGMGVVFKARHRESGRVVALKILLPSFGRDRDAVIRFRREFEVAARIDHPNVVAALEASEDRGVQFLTMEYVEGNDLADLVRTVGPLPIKQALHCAVQAARGLAAAHDMGIIHRDVKPSNLMLDANGGVRVLDLGLARVIESANTLALAAGAGLTQTGAFLGTADFVAPEQADDPKQAGPLADVYSLGCTLHYLVAGRPPFGGKTVLQRLMAHQHEPAPSLHDARDDVPDLLEHVYQEMMAKRPGAGAFNTVRLVARKRKLEVFVNSARVLNPLIFDRDLTPARVWLGLASRTPIVRAEFDKVEIRALDEEPSEAIEPNEALAKPVRAPSDGGLIMPDGSRVFEGSQLKVDHSTGGKPQPQGNMDDFVGSRWTNNRQLLWDKARQGDVLALAVPVEEAGQHEIRALLTTSPDFGRVKFEIDGKPLGQGPFIDLYNPQVRNTGAVPLGFVTLDRGTSLFKVTVVGRARPSAGFAFGLDELQLIPVR